MLGAKGMIGNNMSAAMLAMRIKSTRAPRRSAQAPHAKGTTERDSPMTA